MSNLASRLFERIWSIYTSGYRGQQPPREASPPQEFQAIMDEHLGPEYDPSKRSAIFEIQSNMLAQQDELRGEFNRGSIRAEVYAEQMVRLTAETFKRIKEVLGDRDFERMFGSSDTNVELIDHDIFESVYGRQASRSKG